MVYFIIVIAIITLDLITKFYIKKHYKINSCKEIIKNKLYIEHVKNTGVAYGIFKNHKKSILIFSVFIISGIFYYILRLIENNTQKKYILSLSMILGGALGNFYERLRYKSVTDFIYIKGKRTPIFNVADTFILIGSILAIIFKDK